LLTDLDADELAAWRHAARVAQLRLWRTGSARLRKWTSGTSLRITVTDPSAPPKPSAAKDTAKQQRQDEDASDRHPDFIGRAVRVPLKVPVDPHPLVVEMRDGMARRGADRWRPYGHRGYVPDWIPDVPRQTSGRMLRIWQGILDETAFRGYRVMVDGQRRAHVVIEANQAAFAVTQQGLWLRLRPEPRPYERGAPRPWDGFCSDDAQLPTAMVMPSRSTPAGASRAPPNS
jgi:hypothetical protein